MLHTPSNEFEFVKGESAHCNADPKCNETSQNADQ